MKIRPALFLCLSLATPVTAQSPCLGNLVPNGDVQSPIPQWIQVSGSATVQPLASFDVTGLGTSSCIEAVLGGTAVVRQSQAFALTAGVDYDFSVDLFTSANTSAINLRLVDAMGGTVPLGSQLSFVFGRARASARFQVPATGDYNVEFAASDTNSVVRFDNFVVREALGPSFTFTQENRQVGGSNDWRIEGEPNQIVAVILTIDGAASPTPFPACGANPVLIDPVFPLFLPLAPALIGAQGIATGQLFVPNGVAGIALVWQPLALPLAPLGCQTGCPVVIGF